MMYTLICPICHKSRQVSQKRDFADMLCRSCAKKQCKPKHGQRLCKFCGKPFTPNSSRQVYCKGPHIRKCPVCGKEYVEDNVENLKRPEIACSYECRAKLTAQTSMNKYGTKAPGNSEQAREKSKKTLLERYGVEYAMQSPELKEKARQALIAKFGVDNVAKDPAILEKRMKSLKDSGFHLSAISKTNLRVADKFKNLGLTVELEHRIGTKLYDLFLPEVNTVVEIDPTYTHNAIGNHWSVGLDKYYHRDKSALARSAGLKCVHIWDWDNVDKIVRWLAPAEKIDAADLEIYRLDRDVAEAFIQENDIRGTCRGQKLYLGLVRSGEVFQVMSLGKPAFDKKHTAQLYRMTTRLGYEVVGGFDSLSSFASLYGFSSVVAYADLSKTDGSEYSSIGMTLARVTPPSKIWSKESQFITDRLLRSGKSKYHSEDDVIDDGWLPMYDCGTAVYEYIN